MLDLHNDINSFNGQGIEGLNKKVMRSYHCSTNRHVKKKSWLRQTLKNRSRKEYFYLNGWEKDLDNNYAAYTIDELDFGIEDVDIEESQEELDELLAAIEGEFTKNN